MIDSISVKELKSLKNINIIDIIDIRNIEKYNNGHMDRAVNIPFEKLLIYYNKYLDINKKYYIYCQKGIQSKKICQLLRNKGFSVVNIIGGYEAWILSE